MRTGAGSRGYHPHGDDSRHPPSCRWRSLPSWSAHQASLNGFSLVQRGSSGGGCNAPIVLAIEDGVQAGGFSGEQPSRTGSCEVPEEYERWFRVQVQTSSGWTWTEVKYG
jgi:hypothetical protein